ncbi:hypothetical protein [Curtobacterium sp. NPDC089689]|uniref:hypothetical protein n=1 Tax=Curtobacterium sp. NPDC089689 TaxID=3363968 RepID=UPI0038238334
MHLLLFLPVLFPVLAGPAGGGGSQHGVSAPIWLIIAAVVVIVVIGVVGIARRRR